MEVMLPFTPGRGGMARHKWSVLAKRDSMILNNRKCLQQNQGPWSVTFTSRFYQNSDGSGSLENFRCAILLYIYFNLTSTYRCLDIFMPNKSKKICLLTNFINIYNLLNICQTRYCTLYPVHVRVSFSKQYCRYCTNCQNSHHGLRVLKFRCQ